MVVAAFVLSVVATIAAVASAVFARSQVSESRHQFQHTGPIVEVSAHPLWAGEGHPLFSGDFKTSAILHIFVVNKGRGEVSINNWGFIATMNGLEASFFEAAPKFSVGERAGSKLWLGPKLPCTIAGLSTEQWQMARSGSWDLADRLPGSWVDKNVRPYVVLGDGTIVKGHRVGL